TDKLHYDRASRRMRSWIDPKESHALALASEASKSFAKRRFRLSQANVRSTTQRRGSTAKPATSALRLTTSIVQWPNLAIARSSPPPLYALSANRWRNQGNRSWMAPMTSAAPSRSCTSAGWASPPARRAQWGGDYAGVGALSLPPRDRGRRPAALGGLDRLAVDDPRRRAGFAAGRFAGLQQQRKIGLFQNPAVTPRIKVVLHRRERRKLPRQLTPLAARPGDVEERVNHRPQLDFPRSPQIVSGEFSKSRGGGWSWYAGDFAVTGSFGEDAHRDQEAR